MVSYALQLETYLKEARLGLGHDKLERPRDVWRRAEAKPEDRSADPEWMEKCMQFCWPLRKLSTVAIGSRRVTSGDCEMVNVACVPSAV